MWSHPPTEYIERRLIETLAARGVLPLNALQAACAHCHAGREVPAVLSRLIEEGVVVRRAHRRILWYMGYALRELVEAQPDQGEIPAPFQRLLNELARELR